MTAEEKLKTYLKENAIKSKYKARKEVKPAKPEATKSVIPEGIYFREAFLFFFRLILITFLACFISFTTFEKGLLWSEEKAIAYTLFIAGAVPLIAVGVWIIKWTIYVRVIREKYYPLRGWDEFIAMRSREFWRKPYYTPVTISILLSRKATSLHHEAAMLFMKRWAKKWGNRYNHVAWEAGGGSPRDFVANQRSVQGDLSEGENGSLINVLTHRFIPLARLLGPYLEAVEIQSRAEEREHKVKKEKRDAYDRQSARDAGRSLGD